MTNGEFHHFDPSFRIPVDLDKLEFVVLNELFREGDSYVSELAELKAAELEMSISAGSAMAPRGPLPPPEVRRAAQQQQQRQQRLHRLLTQRERA